MTGPELIALIIAALAVWWVVSRAIWPKKACPALLCDRGRNLGSNQKRWGNDCKKCGGRGEVPRRGARSVRKAIGRPL